MRRRLVRTCVLPLRRAKFCSSGLILSWGRGTEAFALRKARSESQPTPMSAPSNPSGSGCVSRLSREDLGVPIDQELPDKREAGGARSARLRRASLVLRTQMQPGPYAEMPLLERLEVGWRPTETEALEEARLNVQEAYVIAARGYALAGGSAARAT